MKEGLTGRGRLAQRRCTGGGGKRLVGVEDDVESVLGYLGEAVTDDGRKRNSGVRAKREG